MGKRLLSMIILVSFALSVAAMNVSAKTTKPTNLLILGDSISTGYGLSGDKTTSKSFGNLLAKAFGLTGKTYTNLAVNGATSADLLSVVSGHLKSVSSSDTIMISIGGNDVLGVFVSNIKTALGLPAGATIGQLQLALLTTSNAVTLISTQLQKAEVQAQFVAAQADFTKNFNSTITAIKAANPTARLYVQTVYNPFDDVPDFSKYVKPLDSITSALNTAIQKGAAAGKYTIIDTYSAFKGKSLTLTNIASFDIHPNEAGHFVIFNAAYTAITGKKYITPAPPSTKPTALPSAKPAAPTLNPAATVKTTNPETSGNADMPIAITGLAAVFSCIGIAVARKKSY